MGQEEMKALIEALMRGQDVDLKGKALDAGVNYAMGMPSGLAGIPGDIAGLAGAVYKGAHGVPVSELSFDSGFGTDAIGRAMGADVDSLPFIAGSIGLPGLEDMVKPAAIGVGATGLVAALNRALGLKQGSGHLDELGGALMAANAPGAEVSQAAYHGSPHKFDKFSMDKIGTGEGAQAYGHGLYFAEDPGVAGTYKQTTGIQPDFGNYAMTDEAITELQKLVDSYDKQGDWLSSGAIDELTTGDFDPSIIRKQLISNATDEGVDVDLTVKRFDDAVKKAESYHGNLYEVDIPDEQIAKMLDWDKPLSEQPESVRKALEGITLDASNSGGLTKHKIDQFNKGDYSQIKPREIMESLGNGDYESPIASKALNELGIPGIKYLDGTSRSAGEGTRNFVVFDEKSVKTLKRNGEDLLPLDEASRMARAKEMGFDTEQTVYHGTNADVTNFDDAAKGRATKARSAKKAHWFTDDAPTAAGYADFAKDREVMNLLDEARRHERGNRWEKVHELEAKAEMLDQGPQERGQNLIPANLRGNLFEFDADGERYNNISAKIEEVLDKAKADGFDGVKFNNLVDHADYSLHNPATHYAIFDPKNIRSVNAKFDPSKKDSANLMAGVAGGGLVAAMLANDNQQ